MAQTNKHTAESAAAVQDDADAVQLHEPPQDLKARMKTSYDAIAPAYNEWTRKHDGDRMRFLDRLYAAVPKLSDPAASATVLELGCGAGKPTTETLLDRGGPQLRVIANDLSATQLALARTNLAHHMDGNDNDRVSFRPGDMTTLSVADGSLTAVVAMYSLIHLPKAEQAQMVRNVARWLEPGGCLLSTFGGAAADGQVMEHWLGEEGWVYWSAMAPDELVNVMEAAGLRVDMWEFDDDPETVFLWVIARKV